MESEYREEKKKLKTRFTIFYISSIVLLAVVFGALWIYNSNDTEVSYAEIPNEDAEQIALLNEDALLHENLMRLDDLDINYSKLLAASADSKALDSINDLINTSEIAFSKLLDRMYDQKKLFKNPSNAEKSDSIIYAFISALNAHKSNNVLRSAFPANGENADSNTLAILQFQIEVQDKEDTIRNLRKQLKYQESFSKNSFTAQQNIQPATANELLQSNLKIQQDSIKNLLALYNSVLKDNTNLVNQLNKAKSNAATIDAAMMPDKINDLNDKIDDLYSELALAKIDCNLTRANSKDIIYNSRQRKDLLEKSLASLKNLSNSDNPVIQRKVKDKLQLLQDIAATVRD